MSDSDCEIIEIDDDEDVIFVRTKAATCFQRKEQTIKLENAIDSESSGPDSSLPEGPVPGQDLDAFQFSPKPEVWPENSDETFSQSYAEDSDFERDMRRAIEASLRHVRGENPPEEEGDEGELPDLDPVDVVMDGVS